MKYNVSIFILILLTYFNCIAEDKKENSFLNIKVSTNKKILQAGENAILILNFSLLNEDNKISSHPELLIKIEENNSSITLKKFFFTASELDYKTKKNKNFVFLDLDKELKIPFTVNQEALEGRHQIIGELIFTIVFKDGWSMKTFQKFNTSFFVRENHQRGK